MREDKLRKIRVIVNPKSGLKWSFDAMRRALDQVWDVSGTDLVYQFCQSGDDGYMKAKCAVNDGVDVILVAGGDGTINTIGRALIDTDVALGVIPAGSGNGFARHFGIPLVPTNAVKALANALVRKIDVGIVNDRPFFVTCSMAWDASIAKGFARSRIRGVLPYIFAGVNEFFEYEPQDMVVDIGAKEKINFKRALVFTIANMTQFGGGAKIAPHAQPDDGYLELVVALHQDVPKLFANIGKLFDGSIDELPEVITRRFKELTVTRPRASPIQIDGELIDEPQKIYVKIVPSALNVLVP
jgi:YegS/Rv2252/BmrU family lipid kinase